MNIPIFELGIGRAAILGWRDEATLSAIGLLHEASSRAMKVLEDQMDAVAFVNATARAEAFARDIVRPAMRALVGQVADDWFNAQARALRQVDARLEALALRFAAMGERPSLPLDEVTAGWVPPAWLRGPAHKVGSALERLSSDVANAVVSNVLRQGTQHVLARFGREVGERAGVYERLRIGGRGELTRMWLDPALPGATPRPYLAQLLDRVDRTSKEAMEIIA